MAGLWAPIDLDATVIGATEQGSEFRATRRQCGPWHTTKNVATVAVAVCCLGWAFHPAFESTLTSGLLGTVFLWGKRQAAPQTVPTSFAPSSSESEFWTSGWFFSAAVGAVTVAALCGFSIRYHYLRSSPAESERLFTDALPKLPAIGADDLLRESSPPFVWKKFLPLAIISFAAIFSYTLLSNTKDVLIVTAPRSGAEALPFVKTYVNLPGAVLWTVLLAHLSNRMSQANVFVVVVLLYMAFFLLFLLVLYPARNSLHPEGFADRLAEMLPASFMAPIALFRYWTYSAYYLMAESWGTVVVCTVVWGLTNQICSIQEAKYYYPALGFWGNLAPVFAGQYGRLASAFHGTDAVAASWDIALLWITSGVIVSGLVMLCGCYYIQFHVMTDPKCVDAAQRRQCKHKTTLSLLESARLLWNSAYLRSLAVALMGYGLSINMVDTVWKSKLRTQFPDPTAYSAFMGTVSSLTGFVTLAMMVLSRVILRRCKWGTVAALTPAAMGVAGIAFFSLILAPTLWAPVADALTTTPLALAVFMGAFQSCISKSFKWSLFDPCKNMAFIPLESEAQTKGKAAIDVIGAPLGKSGSSFVQQGLIIGLGSLDAAAPVLAVGVAAITVGWLHAVAVVSDQFESLTHAIKETPPPRLSSRV
jgi:AAA family ATP:ADP antiporter